MSAYVIVDIEIHDAAGYDEYRKVVGATLSAYGGNFVVRGGRIDVLEGSWNPKRIVVLEFDSATRANPSRPAFCLSFIFAQAAFIWAL